MVPTRSAKAKSPRVSPPKSRRARMGRAAQKLVASERTMTSDMERL
jgi:hypothetical protein